MTVVRANMSSDQAAEWLRVHGHEIAQSGQRLTMTTVACGPGDRGDAVTAAYQAACEEYRRTAEVLADELSDAAAVLSSDSDTNGART